MDQLMPLPLAVSCFIKIQIGFTFLVLAHLGNPGRNPEGCKTVVVVVVVVVISCYHGSRKWGDPGGAWPLLQYIWGASMLLAPPGKC